VAVPKLVSGPMPPRRLLGRPEAQDLAATRLPWVFGFMAFWGVLIFLRLIWLQGIEHRTYRERADRQHTTVVPIPPIRGEIRDRRGASLALSIKVESLFCRPPVFYPNHRVVRGEGERHWGEPDRAAADRVAARLAPLLDRPRHRIREQLLRKRCPPTRQGPSRR
jgi:cell division protein FtsI/penicillin-binding protein 2